MIYSYRDIKAFTLSYSLAMEVFLATKAFPKEERYCLTDQIRRSSRSISANIVEGWSKRRYANIFIRHLVDSIGSCDETKLWLQFARDCGYLNSLDHDRLIEKCNEVGRVLHGLLQNWGKPRL